MKVKKISQGLYEIKANNRTFEACNESNEWKLSEYEGDNHIATYWTHCDTLKQCKKVIQHNL